MNEPSAIEAAYGVRYADPLTADMALVVDEARFMANVREALVNGYDRLCSRCGIGTAGDDMDIHERACPEFTEA